MVIRVLLLYLNTLTTLVYVDVCCCTTCSRSYKSIAAPYRCFIDHCLTVYIWTLELNLVALTQAVTHLNGTQLIYTCFKLMCHVRTYIKRPWNRTHTTPRSESATELVSCRVHLSKCPVTARTLLYLHAVPCSNMNSNACMPCSEATDTLICMRIHRSSLKGFFIKLTKYRNLSFGTCFIAISDSIAI